MENLSATSLYVQACKFLLCGEDRSSWDQLVAILPQLRNALTCRVCRGLIVDPLSSGYCQHYVCRPCLKRKRALNPGCKWCLDLSKLRQSDEQIRVVLACYKLLCKAIKSSSYYVTSDKNLAIDNLLKEAELNSDVLPNSSLVVSNNYNIKSASSDENMAVNVNTSRDQLSLNAREKTGVVVANEGGKVNDTKKILESATNGVLETFDEKAVEHLRTSSASLEEENSESQTNTVKIEADINIDCNNTNTTNRAVTVGENQQPCINGVKIETDETNIDYNGPGSAITVVENDDQMQQDTIKIRNGNDHLNGNSEEMYSNTNENPAESNSGAKNRLIRKVKSKHKRAGLRPRNGQLVQKFETGRYMRKRKLATQNNHKHRPRKKCKISVIT